MPLTISLVCPACGGTLTADSDDTTISCPYCSLLLAIEADDRVKVITLKNTLDKDGAMKVAMRWLGRATMAWGLRKNAKIMECYPVHLPFWKQRIRAAGWVCGKRLAYYRGGRYHKEPVYKDVEEIVLNDFSWTRIACDPGDIGAEHLQIADGLATLHDENVFKFDVTVSSGDARDEAQQWVETEAWKSARVDRASFCRLHYFPDDLKLIYYPVWIIRYEFFGRMYSVTISGVDGHIIAGRAPASILVKSTIATLVTAAFGFAGGYIMLLPNSASSSLSASGSLRHSGSYSCLPCCFPIIFSIIPVALAYFYYRYKADVTVGHVKDERALNWHWIRR